MCYLCETFKTEDETDRGPETQRPVDPMVASCLETHLATVIQFRAAWFAAKAYGPVARDRLYCSHCSSWNHERNQLGPLDDLRWCERFHPYCKHCCASLTACDVCQSTVFHGLSHPQGDMLVSTGTGRTVPLRDLASALKSEACMCICGWKGAFYQGMKALS